MEVKYIPGNTQYIPEPILIAIQKFKKKKKKCKVGYNDYLKLQRENSYNSN